MFSSFWDAAFDKFFEGESAKVPFATPQSLLESKHAFSILGRIIYHGYCLTREIPLRFCEASFISLIHGEESSDKDTLTRSFMLYISSYEKALLDSVMDGKELAPHAYDGLLALYEHYGMVGCIPASNPHDLQEHIVKMAHHELVYKPMLPLMWIKEGMESVDFKGMKQVLAVERIKSIYGRLVPSVDRVLAKLTTDEEDLPVQESRVMHYLRMYIGSLDNKALDKFLRFVQASSASPQKPLKVAFNATTGLRRFPSSSTCSKTLFLSKMYNTYSEFKREFDAVLKEKISFEMGLL